MPVRAVTKSTAVGVAAGVAVGAAAVAVAAAVVAAPIGIGVLVAQKFRYCGEEKWADDTLARMEAQRVAEYEAYRATIKAGERRRADGERSMEVLVAADEAVRGAEEVGATLHEVGARV